jgi:hypothetical protein
VIPPQRSHGRAGLTAIAGVACWFALSGVGSCGGAEKTVRWFADPGERAIVRYSKTPLTHAAEERFATRTTLVTPPASRTLPNSAMSRTLVTARSDAVVAETVEHDKPLLNQARAAAADADRLIDDTVKDPTARKRAKECLKGGTTTAAGKVAADAGGDLRKSRPVSIDVESKIVPVFSACLQKWYPEAKQPIKVLGQGLSKILAAHSAEVSQTDATTQDYVDWLLYTADLAAESEVEPPPPDAEVEPSPTENSMETLLGAVFVAHRGRLAVRRREWQAAIANRTEVISELEQLEGRLAPALETSRARLLQAMRTSVRSDRKHATRCGDRCAARLDRQATREKQAFLRAYHPFFAKKYRGRLHERDF